MSRLIENPRELILGEAKKILYSEGYSGVSIRRIAKECDIATGTIYNYFPTKRDLIIDMMTSFWEEYFYDIEILLSSQDNFYTKLEIIFKSLAQFINKFRDIWLKDELYSSPDYIESGLKRQDIYINKLISIVEKLVKEEQLDRSEEEQLNAKNMASFIVMNFITMVQMPYFDYEFFESLLKVLI